MQKKFMACAIEIAGEGVKTPGTLPYGVVVVMGARL
jgi:hypothetical protein